MYILSLLPLVRSKSQGPPTFKIEKGGFCKYIIPRKWGSWGHLEVCLPLSTFISSFLVSTYSLLYPSLPPPPQPEIKKYPIWKKNTQYDSFFFFFVVGLKLNSVDPTMSIDLKYLGVQLPLAPATSFPFWNLTGANPASPGECTVFVNSNKFVIKIKCYHC